MTGELRTPAALRPGDPRRLGPYELIGRLGEGGMGTVYLAQGPQGVPVAVKMVRADLAPDGEFRRRFRSEVNRVRQVPPFCTAEVLDADPDHEHPYLVVEYVDAPSLAEVVQERGPLSAANLHSVAIGVATALTAIHGAGVIHRDLKPRNVLLAPGSPKVIDFGIARALEATSGHTRTDQMVGTVAYMAPERFGSEPGTALTPAADIFAWGAVVGYAGTGRTPFGADSPPATAARILTQPPDLSGLSGPLRTLVGHSLEKQPGDRPTSRELLDMLLGSGPRRSAATAAALAHQPGLQAAARDAQAATDFASARQFTAAATPAQLAAFTDDEESTAGAQSPDAQSPDAQSPGAQPPDAQPAGPRFRIPAQMSAVPISSAGAATVVRPVPGGMRSGPAEPQPPTEPFLPAELTSPGDPKRRWLLPLTFALLIVALLGGGLLVREGYPTLLAGDDPGSDAVAVPEVSAAELDPAFIEDSLLGPRLWTATSDAEGECLFAGGLVVRRTTRGPYRCDGPDDALSIDQRVEVGVRLLRADSCASIWFRFREFLGYQVRVCDDRVLVGWHKSRKVQVYRTFPLDDHLEIGGPATRIRVAAYGDTVAVARDGVPLGTVTLTDPDITSGKVSLGIFTRDGADVEDAEYAVVFNDVKIWSTGP